MKKTILFLTVALMSLIVGCSKGNSAPVDMSKQDKQEPVVKTEIVQERDLQLFAQVTGRLEGIVDMLLYSEVSGKVDKVNVTLGKFVNKGDEIAAVNIADYKIALMQANADLTAAEAGYEAAKIKLEASGKLYDKEKVSKYEYTNDKSALKKSEGLLEGAKANVEKAKRNYDNSRFVAPVSGYIAQLNIKTGQLIASGQPLCAIELALYVRTASVGKVVTEYSENSNQYNVRIKLKDDQISDLNNIENLKITYQSGKKVFLKDICTFEIYQQHFQY